MGARDSQNDVERATAYAANYEAAISKSVELDRHVSTELAY